MTGKHNPKDPACLAVFARLSEYVDGELSDEECQHLEEHMADCPPCVEFLRSLKGCIRAGHELGGTPDCPPVPAELESKLKAAWQAALARRR